MIAKLILLLLLGQVFPAMANSGGGLKLKLDVTLTLAPVIITATAKLPKPVAAPLNNNLLGTGIIKLHLSRQLANSAHLNELIGPPQLKALQNNPSGKAQLNALTEKSFLDSYWQSGGNVTLGFILSTITLLFGLSRLKRQAKAVSVISPPETSDNLKKVAGIVAGKISVRAEIETHALSEKLSNTGKILPSINVSTPSMNNSGNFFADYDQQQDGNVSEFLAFRSAISDVQLLAWSKKLATNRQFSLRLVGASTRQM
jgi:hypothetical protein